MNFTILFSLTVLIVVFGVMRNLRRSKVTSHITIEELVRRLRPVPDGLTTLALHHLHPTESAVALDYETVWTMIEGTEGLASMKENTQVLLAMASYAQRWDPLGSIEVAEHMRRDALDRIRPARRALQLPGTHLRPGGRQRLLPDASTPAGILQSPFLASSVSSLAGRI
jgi:hypothetical protein